MIDRRSCLQQTTEDFPGETLYKPDPAKLKNIIKAYGNIDLEVGYNQGYNYIISLLLRFIADEEDVFWCLLTIMSNM